MSGHAHIVVAILLAILIPFGISSAAQQPPAQPAEPKTAALPWPGPDMWSMTQQEWVGDRWINAWMLLEYKTVYVQSALPPEESGTPSWLSERYKSTSPESAQLRIFVRATQATERKLDWSTGTARVYGIPGTKTEQRIAYQILVTNAQEKRVMTGFGYTISEAWDDLLRMVRFEEERQERARLKVEKERQKAEQKKKKR